MSHSSIFWLFAPSFSQPLSFIITDSDYCYWKNQIQAEYIDTYYWSSGDLAYHKVISPLYSPAKKTWTSTKLKDFLPIQIICLSICWIMPFYLVIFSNKKDELWCGRLGFTTSSIFMIYIWGGKWLGRLPKAYKEEVRNRFSWIIFINGIIIVRFTVSGKVAISFNIGWIKGTSYYFLISFIWVV